MERRAKVITQSKAPSFGGGRSTWRIRCSGFQMRAAVVTARQRRADSGRPPSEVKCTRLGTTGDACCGGRAMSARKMTSAFLVVR